MEYPFRIRKFATAKEKGGVAAAFPENAGDC
jgi:hypothetical protein